MHDLEEELGYVLAIQYQAMNPQYCYSKKRKSSMMFYKF